MQALDEGIDLHFPDYVLHKMVTVMRGGQEVKISKRAGSYVSLRDLMDWSGDGDPQRGRDAVRFFLISRRADSEFQFDVDLALSRSDENPVYYVQYAHARICSVLRQAQQQFDWQAHRVEAQHMADLGIERLSSERELALCALLARWPSQVQEAAEQLAPHAIAFTCVSSHRPFTLGTTPIASWSRIKPCARRDWCCLAVLLRSCVKAYPWWV